MQPPSGTPGWLVEIQAEEALLFHFLLGRNVWGRITPLVFGVACAAMVVWSLPLKRLALAKRARRSSGAQWSLRPAVLVALSAGGLGCGEGGDLAVSAGAPVIGMVEGRITDCGIPVPEAEVRLLVDQADVGQARPVHAELGPVISDGHGTYALEVSPAFAIPGPVLVRPRVRPPEGDVHEFPGQTMELSLGEAEDTLRLDADLGDATGGCR